jgi:hypothetical protein
MFIGSILIGGFGAICLVVVLCGRGEKGAYFRLNQYRSPLQPEPSLQEKQRQKRLYEDELAAEQRKKEEVERGWNYQMRTQ